jgi:ribulose-5-phosphate 4-epimerase/fuculose-1-phosphate aldolase
VDFTPTADKLIPDLTPREELALLARTPWREEYNDHLAGHITISLGDGTLLCNPWLLTWDELRPHDVIRIDLDGNVVEDDWPVPLGIPLHLELHRARDDVRVAMHNHPLYGTVWSDMREVPPALDQSYCLGGGELVLVEEYAGSVDSSDAAAQTVAALGERRLVLPHRSDASRRRRRIRCLTRATSTGAGPRRRRDDLESFTPDERRGWLRTHRGGSPRAPRIDTTRKGAGTSNWPSAGF